MNEELFLAYCDQFYGYGSWTDPIWFVGIEEAGPTTQPQAEARIQAWNEAGRGHLKNLRQHCEVIQGLGQEQLLDWFQPNAALQPTWKQLIRVLLSPLPNWPNGQQEQDGAVLQYQIDHWGGANSMVSDLSIFPLAFSGRENWAGAYQNRPMQACLQSLNRYKNYFLSRRTYFLRLQIRAFQPRVVVIYSENLRYRQAFFPAGWAAAALPLPGTNWQILQVSLGQTNCFFIRHPSPLAWGGQNPDPTYYSLAGQAIHHLLG